MEGFTTIRFSNKEFGSFLATRRMPLVELELHTIPESLHPPLA
jgi:hypothetical protein